MTNTTQSTPQQAHQQAPPLVHPGERALLLSHHEYRRARVHGQGLGEYDLLMRRPEDVGTEADSPSEDERWMPVPASKYLKHRAIGWREAESPYELPDQWFEQAIGRGAFPEEQAEIEGGE